MGVARENVEGRKYLFDIFIFCHGEFQAAGRISNL